MDYVYQKQLNYIVICEREMSYKVLEEHLNDIGLLIGQEKSGSFIDEAT